MFDDLKQDNKSAITNSQNSASQNTTPNVSNKSVDDMFGDVDPMASQPGVLDANKPSAVQSGKIKPVSQTSTPNVYQTPSLVPKPQNITAPNIPPADSMMISDDKSSGIVRKLIIAILVIVLLAIVGGGVYYFFLRTSPVEQPLEQNDNTNNVVNDSTNLNDNNVNEGETIINEDELDDDFDGLNNGVEKQLGTNPFEADSDNDGVFDQDEVETYKTDPLSDDSDSDGLSDHEEIIKYLTDPNDPDTDGDTFLDGVEVLNGYNPLGNGKLEDMNNNLNTNDNI